jgi:hypothetical protein
VTWFAGGRLICRRNILFLKGSNIVSKSITIVRGTIFAGKAVEPGDVIAVEEAREGEADFLIRNGKAVDGAVTAEKVSSNKQAKVEDKK